MPVKDNLGYTMNALASIRSSHETRVLVVDDGSKAEVRRWFTENGVEWIDGSAKKGLAAKWNLGTSLLWEWGADYVAILNNDILLAPTWVDGCVRRISRGDASIVLGTDVSHFLNPPERVLTYFEQVEDIDSPWGSWSAFMISREAWKIIGPFDEDLVGIDFEDWDYLCRASQAGKKPIATTLAPFYHYGGKTKKISPEFQRLHKINEDVFRRKHGFVPR